MHSNDARIQSIIDAMDLDMKIGQLFLLAYPGKDPQQIARLIEQFGICGCYLSQDNAETTAEARTITTELQAMATQTTHRLPMLLGVDQEGAWGVLVPESTTGPGNLALGANPDPTIAERMYRVFGEEMLAVGYNAILAPSADVNSNPRSPIIGTRSFGDDPHRVGALVAHAVRGARATGALTALKHFPGHGATEGDTHRGIPEVRKTLDQLLDSDFVPFRAGIDAGADMVMTAHIRYPLIDPAHPATLSATMLQAVLRDRLGFDGVILSDSMNMGAIRRFYDPGESTVLALQAGVDLLMLSEEHYEHSEDYLEKQLASLRAVRRAIEDGTLAIELIDDKLRRIIKLKLDRMSTREAPHPCLSIEERQATAREAARNAICLIGSARDRWPIPLTKQTVVVNATPRAAYSNLINPRGIGPNQAIAAFDTFCEALRELGASDVLFLEHDAARRSPTLLDDATAVILVTEDYPLPGEDIDKTAQQAFVKECIQRYPRTSFVVGLRSPYELLVYGQSIPYLCTYSSRTCSAREAAHLIVSGDMPEGVHHLTL